MELSRLNPNMAQWAAPTVETVGFRSGPRCHCWNQLLPLLQPAELRKEHHLTINVHLYLSRDQRIKSKTMRVDMSNSDELRHTDNTTLVPPRLPDTLPQVYHMRHPTLGLLILPSVSLNPATIRRTARISIPPIEPNLAERARISAINLDYYQLDPITLPPSPSSPFMITTYQRMIAETDPTQQEKALTKTVEESSLEALSVDELITQLRKMCEDAVDYASNAQEEARQKRKEALEEVIQRIYHNNN
ncbi:hypothetical protein Tco_1302096 [Tanacetum coccineum]